MDRRTSIKWVVAASAALPFVLRPGAHAESRAVRGYGSDPDLLRKYRPGELWPLTLNAAQRRLAGVLSDLIIPADEVSPSAAAVGVVDFIDEWVSAPYPQQITDRALILEGFDWIDAEATRRHGKPFVELEVSQQHVLCDAISVAVRAPAELRQGASFFARYRDLTAGAFYTSPVGRKDLNYIGNVPIARFEGPPVELLKSLGLA